MSRVGQARDKQAHYRAVFQSDNGEPTRSASVILADLAHFCCRTGILSPTSRDHRIDPLALAWASGRREVWDRVQHYLTLSAQRLADAEQAENERLRMMERAE